MLDQPQAIADSTIATAGHDIWYYQPTGASVGASELEPAQQLPVPSSSMIGPASSFYTAEDGAIGVVDTHTQYQQWLGAYATQQQQHQTQHQQSASVPQITMHTSYGSSSVQAPRPHQPTVFHFSQAQYPSTSAMGQYIGSSVNPGNPTAVQPDIGLETVGATSYPTHADIFPPFYPDLHSVTGSSSSSPDQGAHSYHTSTPDSTVHTYSNVSDLGYQQQHAQAQPSFSSSQPP